MHRVDPSIANPAMQDNIRGDVDDAEVLVQEINKKPLDDLRAIIASLVPSMSFTSTDG